MEHGLFSAQVRDWLALSYAPGIGPVHFLALHRQVAEINSLFQPQPPALPDELRLSAAMRNYLRKPDWARVDKDLQWAQENQCHILSLADPRYPPLLREIADPPPLLFIRGNPALLLKPQLAMVGSRNPSAGGRQLAQSFARQLSACGLTVTSGLAIGIDTASHLGALACGAETIAVVGNGLDRVYPARNQEIARQIVQQGAVVSEFSPGTPPLAANFPRRNRIISGLSLGTLVVEAALKSGSLITARLAAEQGREVFALPGSIHNPLATGCHTLIRQGAKLCDNVDHILEELGPLAASVFQARAAAAVQAPAEAKNTDPQSEYLMQNMGYEPTAIDTLVERCGLTPEAVSAMLVSLEMQGRVISTGGLYCRSD